MLNKVTVLLCRQGSEAEVVEIENSLAGMQGLLGANDLETVKPDISHLRDFPPNLRWKVFCDWIDEFPWFREIYLGGEDD